MRIVNKLPIIYVPCYECGNSLKISEVICRIIIFVKDMVGLMSCGLNAFACMMVFSLLLDMVQDVVSVIDVEV